MAYIQDNNPLSGASMFGPSANIFKRAEEKANKTMKVRIKPGKEGELSDYAMDHITKTNKRGKATIEVPKSEMNLSKSKLFNTSKPKWTSNPNADPPSSQPTAKGFKRQRNKDRVLKGVAGTILGGFIGGSAAISSLQNKSGGSMVEDTPDNPTSTFRTGIDRDQTRKEVRQAKREARKEERAKKREYKKLRKNTKPQSKRSIAKSKRRAQQNMQYKNDAKGDGICTTSICLADPVTGVDKNPTKKR
jgi:hypothetical protein